MARNQAAKSLKANARRLRSVMTDHERRLWAALRAHRLGGIGFRRQMPVAGFVVDFAAPRCRVIVELDGAQHAEHGHLRRDTERDARLAAGGWTVLRFWNAELDANFDGVCETIFMACNSRGERQ